MQVSGHGARMRGDTSGPKRLDWSLPYQDDQRRIATALLAEQRAGNDRWTAERSDGLYAPAPTRGLRSWSRARIERYAMIEAERRTNKAIAVHNEQQARAARN